MRRNQPKRIFFVLHWKSAIFPIASASYTCVKLLIRKLLGIQSKDILCGIGRAIFVVVIAFLRCSDVWIGTGDKLCTLPDMYGMLHRDFVRVNSGFNFIYSFDSLIASCQCQENVEKRDFTTLKLSHITIIAVGLICVNPGFMRWAIPNFHFDPFSGCVLWMYERWPLYTIEDTRKAYNIQRQKQNSKVQW